MSSYRCRWFHPLDEYSKSDPELQCLKVREDPIYTWVCHETLSYQEAGEIYASRIPLPLGFKSRGRLQEAWGQKPPLSPTSSSGSPTSTSRNRSALSKRYFNHKLLWEPFPRTYFLRLGRPNSERSFGRGPHGCPHDCPPKRETIHRNSSNQRCWNCLVTEYDCISWIPSSPSTFSLW